MSGWDDSFVDYTSPPDGRITLTVGGSSGNLRLLNGQTIKFPWKRQEQIAGTFPAQIDVTDTANYEFLEMVGPSLVPGTNRAYLLLAGWDDGTNSVVINGGGGSAGTPRRAGLGAGHRRPVDGA